MTLDAAGTPPVKQGATVQDEAYARLRQMLTVGAFVPGERLKIRQVAATVGLGHMPVRAALLRLASEGALVASPHAGMAVPCLSLAEFDDLLRMRLLLEGEAAARGALALSSHDVEFLQSASERMAQALANKDFKTYLAVNEDFHLILYRASGSPLLLSLIDTLWLKAGPVSNQLFGAGNAWQGLNQAHEDLMRALWARNPQAARHAVERDVFFAGQILREQLVPPAPTRRNAAKKKAPKRGLTEDY